MKRGYRNFVKIYRKKLENVFKIGLKYTVGTLADFGKCPFCMQKCVTKLAGTGFLYTDKSRMKKA